MTDCLSEFNTEIVLLLTSGPVIKSLPLHLLSENQILPSFFYAQLCIIIYSVYSQLQFDLFSREICTWKATLTTLLRLAHLQFMSMTAECLLLLLVIRSAQGRSNQGVVKTIVNILPYGNVSHFDMACNFSILLWPIHSLSDRVVRKNIFRFLKVS